MRHFLFLDHGNTATKGLLTDLNFSPVHTFISSEEGVLPSLEAHFPLSSIEGGLYASVGNLSDELKSVWENHLSLSSFSADLPLPVSVSYQTPQTLGADRLASAIGAWSLYPGENLLVLDFGTCLKCDFINRKGCYEGGAISPGLTLRYKSMHTFTAKLPLLTQLQKIPERPVGTSTAESMHVGAMMGLLAEALGMIQFYKEIYPDVKVLISGGDAELFEGRFKNAIFVRQNLALLGLVETKKYHANNPDTF